MSQQSSSWRFSVLSLDTQLKLRDSAGLNRDLFDRLALTSKEVGSRCEFPAAVREECDLFMVAHYVDERSLLSLATIAGLPFARAELAVPLGGGTPFTVRRLLCFRIAAARLILSSESCLLLEEENRRRSAAAEAAAALEVAQMGDDLLAQLELMQTTGMRDEAVPLGGFVHASAPVASYGIRPSL